MSENPSAPTPRIFTIGTVRITEDASMTALSYVTWNMIRST